MEAELLDDVLGPAAHLHNADDHQAASVMAGSVLEAALRTLCGYHSIRLLGRPKLDQMNSGLVKAGAYPKLTQKRLTALADIRNSAAHGNLSAFNGEDVAEMFKSVRRFVKERFS